MPLTFGSLFAGIGGFDLGLERAGMTCKWQVEIDDYATRVLEKHWPDVRRWRDVRTFPPNANGHGSSGETGLSSKSESHRTKDRLSERACCQWHVDLICGGFPCQDISYAGHGRGINGERSGLWAEYVRIIRLLRPRVVLVENVAALLTRGMDRVLGDLASCGYDAQWDVLAASDVGAPHIRERVFIVANATGDGFSQCGSECWNNKTTRFPTRKSESVSCDSDCKLCKRIEIKQSQGSPKRCDWWAAEPNVGRVAHGVPNRVDRLRGLGNAVVPQVAEWIGRRIVESVCLEG